MVKQERALPPYYPFYIFFFAIAVAGLIRLIPGVFIDLGAAVIFIMVFGGILLLIFCFARLEMAAIAFVFVFPIAQFELPTIPFYFTFGDAYTIILGIAWFARISLRSQNRLVPTFLDRPLFFYFFFSIVALMKSVNLMGGFVQIGQDLEYLVLAMYLFSVLINSKEMMDGLFQALAMSSLMFSLFGLVEYFQNGGGGYRIMSVLGHFNAFGCYLSMMIPLIFNLFLIEKNRWFRTFYIIAVVVDMGALGLTFSRGAWIATLLGVIVSGQLRGLGQFVKVMSLVLFVVIAGSLFVPERYIGRATSITQVTDSASLMRLRQYNYAWEIIQKYPLIGGGMDNLLEYFNRVYNWPSGAAVHNLFLYIGAERGAPAMLVMAWIFFVFYWNIIAYYRRSESPYFRSLYVGIASAVTSFLIANFPAYMLVRGVGVFFGLLLGLFVAATQVEAAAEEVGDEEFFPVEIRRSPTIYVES